MNSALYGCLIKVIMHITTANFFFKKKKRNLKCDCSWWRYDFLCYHIFMMTSIKPQNILFKLSNPYGELSWNLGLNDGVHLRVIVYGLCRWDSLGYIVITKALINAVHFSFCIFRIKDLFFVTTRIKDLLFNIYR